MSIEAKALALLRAKPVANLDDAELTTIMHAMRSMERAGKQFGSKPALLAHARQELLIVMLQDAKTVDMIIDVARRQLSAYEFAQFERNAREQSILLQNALLVESQHRFDDLTHGTLVRKEQKRSGGFLSEIARGIKDGLPGGRM